MRMSRGKRKDGKGWAYGWPIKTDFACYIVPAVYVVNWKIFVEVTPTSVGQSTGLKDKKGKEIYGSIEIDGKMSKGGDIVKVMFGEQELIYACEWYTEIGAWVFRGNGEWLMYEDVFETCEIIGNVTDTPNLLEAD